MNDLTLELIKEERHYLKQLGIELPYHLKTFQLEALRHIMNDMSFLCVIPTTAGKTILGVLQSVFSTKIKGKKSCFIAPYRSLTIEHVETLSKYLTPMLDNGSHPKTIEDYIYSKFDVVVSTTEKMDAIIRNFNYGRTKQKRDIVFGELDSIIIDEIHGIEDGRRGVNLESFIMSVKYLYPHIKIIGLSATIGNKEEFAEWLGAELVFAPSSERPVPLSISTVPIYSTYKSKQFEEKLSYINQEVIKYKKEKIMIAVSAVWRTEAIVKRLCGFQQEDTTKNLKYFITNFGMAWHFSGSRGMSEADQMAVEWSFQYEDLPDEEDYKYEYTTNGINYVVDVICRKEWLRKNYGITKPINLIVCTPTLIVGRNLPVTRIYIYDHTFFSYLKGEKLIPANRLQQTIGRAGRLKFAKGKTNYKGYGIIMATHYDCDEMYNRAVTPFEIISSLKYVLGEKILAWINSRIVSTKEEIVKFLHSAMDSKIKDNLALIDKKIEYLIKYKFITPTDDMLTITGKGIKTVKFYIQPETVVQWGFLVYKTLTILKTNPSEFSLIEFMIGTMAIIEYIDGISILDREVNAISTFVHKNNIDKDIDMRAVKAFMFSFPEYTHKKLNEYNEELASKVKIPKEESKSILIRFKRLIGAMYDIYGGTSVGEKIEICKAMINSGTFDPELAHLISLPGIGLTYANRLLSGGLKTKKDIINLYMKNKRKLMGIMMVNSTKLSKMVKNLN